METTIKRNMIVMAELNSEGSVQGGFRPCVVISNDKANTYSPILIVVPVTSQNKKYIPTHVSLEPNTQNGLQARSTVLAEQLLTIPKSKVKAIVGALSERESGLINKAIQVSLAI